MDSRRDFLKKAAALGAAGGWPAAVERAFAIEPEPGSTVFDAEHVVILMQENRSFDHAYGTLRGVRGFNDPRAKTLPDGNPVWLQTDNNGDTWQPFRLDLKGTHATWMGCLPHNWPDQLGAWNGGAHDQWLMHKASSDKKIAHLPLTLGFHSREDIPFYYALADAFTVCDQNFCSSLTGTTPNRLHLWTGTIRAELDPEAKAHVFNSEADLNSLVSWKTFPERLEEQGISWAVYQNELTVQTGLGRDEESWLSNFGDNPLEYFSHYGVHFHAGYRKFLEALTAHLSGLEARNPKQEQTLQVAQRELEKWSAENFSKRPAAEQSIHRKAFVVNTGDPHFRDLEEVSYQDGAEARKLKVPRGDVLHQFRQDVNGGKLPAVSWLVAPQLFSDHPDSPWYGAWYIAEVMDILTSRPEVWKKTVFILCYDENDGYFDHIPPFVPPDPAVAESGKASPGLRPELERVRGHPVADGPIGLGYRVPLVIASPWSRGGYVCSEVFDHTSMLQFLEVFLTKKTGRQVTEPNISPWRRAMCGDLTSAFRPGGSTENSELQKMDRTAFLTQIHAAKFKPGPATGKPLSADEIKTARQTGKAPPGMPRQEPGTRPACALPYQLSAHGRVSAGGKAIELHLTSGPQAGAPFHVYAPGESWSDTLQTTRTGLVRHYAVKAGDSLSDTWKVTDFRSGSYHLRVHGPNGFYAELQGTAQDPALEIRLEPTLENGKPTGDAELVLTSRAAAELKLSVADMSYGAGEQKVILPSAASLRHAVPLETSHSWYDLKVTVDGAPQFSRRFAGHVETGRESISDPLMGRASA